MDFSTEMTIMGTTGDRDLTDKIREPLARGIQKTFNHDTVFMQDVKSFAAAVLARANGGKIKRLTIIDHGTKNGCYFGEDWINTGNFETFAPHLGLLSSALDKSGFVHLQHCEVGQNENLLQLFAAIFGVSVYAAMGNESSGAPYSEGKYVRCCPSGAISHNTFPPGSIYASVN